MYAKRRNISSCIFLFSKHKKTLGAPELYIKGLIKPDRCGGRASYFHDQSITRLTQNRFKWFSENEVNRFSTAAINLDWPEKERLPLQNVGRSLLLKCPTRTNVPWKRKAEKCKFYCGPSCDGTSLQRCTKLVSAIILTSDRIISNNSRISCLDIKKAISITTRKITHVTQMRQQSRNKTRKCFRALTNFT